MNRIGKLLSQFRVVLFCFLILMFLCGPWSLASGDDRATSNRPKIGVVFGGGGAKGAAHIGVLKVLEEQKIPVDYIAGTSMGAIVGALYASGLSASELEKVITAIDWKDVFSGDPDRRDIDYRRKREDFDNLTGLQLGIKDGKILRPKGLIKDQKVNVLFETLMLHTSGIDDFDKLPIPYRAVAADLETGEKVVLKSGRLADAARASMSVPGAFPPIELNGRLLIDGGIVDNLPVDIVKEMGADIVICIDVDKPLETREQLGGSFLILNQMIDIMMKKNVREQIKTLGPQDVYINPDLGELSSGDFDKAAKIALLGEKAAREKIDSLKRYSVSDSEYAAFTALHNREQMKEVKIASVKIEIEGESKISPVVVAERLSVKPGDTVNVDKLKKEAGIVYGTGDFERVDLHVNKEQDGYELVVKAKEKSWGPNYLRFGVSLEGDFEGGTSYNFLFDYTRRWVNSLGAEWKTQVNLGNPSGIYSEFYQPLSVKRLFFVSPHIEWKQQPYDVFDGKHRVASYLVKSYEGGIDLGIQPWMYGEARVGLRYGSFRASPKTGEIDLPEDNATRGAVIAGGRLDQLDNVNFPNKGYLAQVGFLSSLKALGSTDEYYKAQGSFVGAYTFKKQTVIATFAAGSRMGPQLPFYDQFELGGLFKLSGLRSRQILGQSMALARLITYHKMGSSFIGDLYLGGSLESGNVWGENEKQFDLSKLRLAGSVFVGYDTIFGPLYLAFGHADGGFNAGYLFLGKPF
ncbi:Periplasmic esterase RssA [Candidatus Sulfobium mesophilum]|uniref:Periplasmic esterase RssA n=1 Tax=Candidatus Sulfobium mesophilum TaxID=2016548 RepID=A0A2U3QJ87_9BACT|nr:Periplasmic esterase RssA [Candidatus Sulfobium mesophilum]